PYASASGSCRVARGWTWLRIFSRASSTEMRPSAESCRYGCASAIVASLPAPSDEAFSPDEIDEEPPELRAHVVARDRDLDGRLQVVELVPDVVAAGFESVGVHRLLLREEVDRVGQLDLAAAPGFRLAERVEDLGREHVAPDRGERG